MRLTGRGAAANAGCKVLTLALSMITGGVCIQDAGRLRPGSAGRVLSFGVRAASTVGSFLRSFTSWACAPVGQGLERALQAAWRAGAAPGAAEIAIDLDSAFIEVHGPGGGGAERDRCGPLGYHLSAGGERRHWRDSASQDAFKRFPARPRPVYV